MSDAFKNMPDQARVWIYTADRLLNREETESIRLKGQLFVNDWSAHQKQLVAAFDVLFDAFLVFMVDEGTQAVSGCGIDKSVHFVRKMEASYQLSFFNRLLLPVLLNDEVELLRRQQLQEMLAEGRVNPETKTFNPLVQKKEDFDASWIIPLRESWIYKSIAPEPASK